MERHVWRLISDDGAGAGDGLAGDEALMLHYGRGEQPPSEATLRLYTYRSHCALVGRYQTLEAEIDLDACVEHDVQVGRRPTGGGAIVMGAGQLGVAIATRAPSGIGPRDLLRRYAHGLIAGLDRLGVDARFRGKNDLEVDGRKIAGLGLYLDERGALLFHASVLADLDIKLMLSVLRIPGAKLSDKGVARVSERVTTITRELGRPTAAADVRDAIAAGFSEALDADLCPSDFDEPERARRAELVEQRYGAPEWLDERTPAADARGTALLKTPAGLLRVYVGVHGDALSSVLASGDFSVPPPSLLSLEAALRWSRADRARIAEIAAATIEPDELGVDSDAVAGAIWEAVERALERGAAPVRPLGSCYFPEPAVAAAQEVR